MDQAIEYKDCLGISYLDCRDIDTSSHKLKMSKIPGLYSRYSEIGCMTPENDFFDGPADHEGMPYIKGADYLAILFLGSGWSREQVQNEINQLIQLKGMYADSLRSPVA